MTGDRQQQDEDYMRMAIARGREGMAAGGSPFGACIVRDGRVIACEHNVVWQTTDATAHAEVNAIRVACRAVGSIKLEGATIYSSTEPCPMCFAAIHWAGMKRIVYGASIADAARAGFSELSISNLDMKRLGGSPVEIVPAFMAAEANELFERWLADPKRRVY
jgi:tRNA(Arg) A34 adenosine deaminase TadA